MGWNFFTFTKRTNYVPLTLGGIVNVVINLKITTQYPVIVACILCQTRARMVEVEGHDGDGGINPAVDQISSLNDSSYSLYTGNGLYGIKHIIMKSK